MFDGDRLCCLCSQEMRPEQRRFGLTLSGHTKVFCSSCFVEKRNDVMKVLHEADD